MTTNEISEETLSALVDGELLPADAAPLLTRMRQDAVLRERVAQLWLHKSLLTQAYRRLPVPADRVRRAGPAPTHRRHAAAAALAVAVAVLCGSVMGWEANEVRLTMTGTEARGVTPAPASADASRIVLHLNSESPQDAVATLTRAESLLEAARVGGRLVLVEIVANSGGLDLLRADVSTQAPRIARLRAAYPELSLVACGQSAERLRERGIALQLLPGASLASSALDQIVLRMRQGWTYVKI
ncbi:MAG: hypothetical protein HY855_05075 [Burkholderiales bacterium]|nr:hypothetical protein [Burkholderiales bacterium]